MFLNGIFFALRYKIFELIMADPKETRKRIKEMRERIFKEADKVSVKNQIEKDAQETNSAPQKSLDKGEISLEEKK